MKVGIPSEIKAQESRVGLTPQSVQQLTNHGHEVLLRTMPVLELVLKMLTTKKLVPK